MSFFLSLSLSLSLHGDFYEDPVLCLLGFVAQLCLTLCDPMGCSLPGLSIHGIFQARILEWVAISSSRGSSQPRDCTWVSHNVGRFFTVWGIREAQAFNKCYQLLFLLFCCCWWCCWWWRNTCLETVSKPVPGFHPGTRVSLLELLFFATDMQLFFFAKLLLILLYHKS